MNLKYSFLLIASIFVTMIHGQAPHYNLISVFTNQREEITSFINNVLRQLPAKKMLELVDCLKQESKYELDDVQLYEKMCNKIMPLRSCLDITKIINLINFQK